MGRKIIIDSVQVDRNFGYPLLNPRKYSKVAKCYSTFSKISIIIYTNDMKQKIVKCHVNITSRMLKLSHRT